MANLVGRDFEKRQIQAAIAAGRNLLLEGPVGVGKTFLALEVAAELKNPVFRVDGDGRYSEQKLTGFFDPPLALKKGFTAETFIAGPLVEAMQSGGILLVNELNRLPEGVQNILLPAIDEGLVQIPKLGEVRAQPDFSVIATQNPKEFVATSHLSEALLDRFELLVLDYQTQVEEEAIVEQKTLVRSWIEASVRLVRMTRDHDQIRRGASIRAAQSLVSIANVLSEQGMSEADAFRESALMALPTRIELDRELSSAAQSQAKMRELLLDLIDAAWSGTPDAKKKS